MLYNNIARVIGPTPPGTGVIALAFTPDVSLILESYGSASETRRILTEVKTGQHAELKDNQKLVMGTTSGRDNILVLRASVTLDCGEFAEVQYSSVKPDSDTKTGYRLSPIESFD